MTFYDSPQVDDNSKRSEESVHHAKGFFSQKNGFLSRTESPDYGVDLDIELIDHYSGATSKKFGVQIKSTTEVKTIAYSNETFVSLPFKTSRLRYLVEREPTYGLILVYSEINQVTYFDYVEEIVNRLNQIKGDDSWKDQDTVSILIPLQTLSNETSKEIHTKFTLRFKNHTQLIKRHGSDFNIPSLSFKTSYEPINIDEDKVSLLEKHGAMLFNENEYEILTEAIESLSSKQINSSSEVLFVAALLYSYTGNIIEGQYYVQKAKRLSTKLSEEKQICLDFAAYYVEFAKGNLTHEEYSDLFFSQLDNPNLSEDNNLLIKINTLWFRFLSNNNHRSADKVTQLDTSHLDDLLKEIENSTIEIKQKHLYKIYLYQTYHAMAIEYFLNTFVDMKLKESLGVEEAVEKRLQIAQKILGIISDSNQTIFDAYKYADDNFKLLKATAAQALCQNFLAFRTAIFSVDYEEDLNFNHTVQYERNYDFGVLAYSIFLELGLYQNAYEALAQIKELVELCEITEGVLIGTKTKEEFETVIYQMQEKYGFKPFVSSVRPIALGKETKDSKVFDDVILRQHAEKIRALYNLPQDRTENIFLDLKTLQTFELKNTNPQIELLQDIRHTFSPETHHATPLFILRHKTTGIETKPSSDIEFLLDQFSTIL